MATLKRSQSPRKTIARAQSPSPVKRPLPSPRSFASVVPFIALAAGVAVFLFRVAGGFTPATPDALLAWLALGVLGVGEALVVWAATQGGRWANVFSWLAGAADVALILTVYPASLFGSFSFQLALAVVLPAATLAIAKKLGASSAVLFRALVAALTIATLSGPFLVEFVLFAAALALARVEVPAVDVPAFLGLDLSDSKAWGAQVWSGMKLFALLFLLLLVEGIIFIVFGVSDAYKVTEVLTRQTPLALALTVLFAPLAEELFFRGYLQKKFGVLLTAVVFGLLHAGFASVFEIVAAISAGLVLGWHVRKYKQLFPAIFAHALYNLYSVLIVTQFLMK